MLGDVETSISTLVFFVWQLAPAFLIWRLRAKESLGLAATLAAAAIFVGGTVATYLLFESSSSSTAGLIFIYSPLYQMTAIFIVFGIEITVRAWHRRRRAI